MKIASVVLCFNRPDYLSQTLASLEKNTEANEVDWFILQDGIVNKHSGVSYSEEEPHRQVTKLAKKSSLPNKTVIVRDNNISPAQQRYKALELLKEYDLLYCFDDDMIVSKYYLRLLRVMANQFPNHIGILYANKPKEKNLRILNTENTARLWGHYMNRDTYSKIYSDYTTYYEHISKYDYHTIIRGIHRKEINIPKISPHIMDDKVINILCRRVGVHKLVPKVSRGVYIGKEGLITYKTPHLWKKRGMERQNKTIEYELDATLSEFILK